MQATQYHTRTLRLSLLAGIAAALAGGIMATSAMAWPHHGPYGHHGHYRHHGRHGHHYRRGHYGHHRYGHGLHRRHYGYRGYHRPYHRSYSHYSPGYRYGRGHYRPYGSTHHEGRYDSDYYGPTHDHERGSATRHDGDYGGASGAGEAADYAADSRGWSLLAQNRPREALRAFGREAERNPTHGGPKVGYALAAAAAGDLDTGVWAMRRACRIDPHTMEQLHVDAFGPGVEKTVEQLGEHYAEFLKRDDRDGDTPFMLASLRYLQGEYPQAKEAIETAVARGDTRPSSRNLQQAIAHRVRDQQRSGDAPALPRRESSGEPELPRADVPPLPHDDAAVGLPTLEVGSADD